MKEAEKLLPEKKWNVALYQLLETFTYMDFTPEESFQDKVTHSSSCLGSPWSTVGSILQKEPCEEYIMACGDNLLMATGTHVV